MLRLLLMLASESISPGEMREVSKVAAVCREAAAVADRSGVAMDGIKFVETSAEAGRLSRDQRSTLFTMCGVYSAGVSDTLKKERDITLEKLDQNTEELRKLLRN